jgi:hypothetical protein
MSRKFAAILVLSLGLSGLVSADTLKLTTGQVIYVFMGRNNDAIQFLGPDFHCRTSHCHF